VIVQTKGRPDWSGLLSFPKVRCRLYLVNFGLASAIRPMHASIAAEYKTSGWFE
jgi:hypothetical protein